MQYILILILSKSVKFSIPFRKFAIAKYKRIYKRILVHSKTLVFDVRGLFNWLIMYVISFNSMFIAH